MKRSLILKLVAAMLFAGSVGATSVAAMESVAQSTEKSDACLKYIDRVEKILSKNSDVFRKDILKGCLKELEKGRNPNSLLLEFLDISEEEQALPEKMLNLISEVSNKIEQLKTGLKGENGASKETINDFKKFAKKLLSTDLGIKNKEGFDVEKAMFNEPELNMFLSKLGIEKVDDNSAKESRDNFVEEMIAIWKSNRFSDSRFDYIFERFARSLEDGKGTKPTQLYGRYLKYIKKLCLTKKKIQDKLKNISKNIESCVKKGVSVEKTDALRSKYNQLFSKFGNPYDVRGISEIAVIIYGSNDVDVLEDEVRNCLANVGSSYEEAVEWTKPMLIEEMAKIIKLIDKKDYKEVLSVLLSYIRKNDYTASEVPNIWSDRWTVFRNVYPFKGLFIRINEALKYVKGKERKKKLEDFKAKLNKFKVRVDEVDKKYEEDYEFLKSVEKEMEVKKLNKEENKFNDGELKKKKEEELKKKKEEELKKKKEEELKKKKEEELKKKEEEELKKKEEEELKKKKEGTSKTKTSNESHDYDYEEGFYTDYSTYDLFSW